MSPAAVAAVALTAAVCCLSLVSCSKSGTVRSTGTDSQEKRLTVIGTMFPQFDFARAIGGEKIDVQMLLRPGSESHSYEPSPADMKQIQGADIFIYNGGENDVWVNTVLGAMDGAKPRTLRLIDCVDVVEEVLVEGMQPEDDDDDGHEHGGDEEEEPEIDEHVWTSPRNAIRIVQKISELMSETDAGNASFYQNNAAIYIAKLKELDKQFTDVVNHAKRRTIVFGDRFPFRYFADDYGLSYYAAFPGCATDVEVSAATLKFLIQKVKEMQIPVVLTIELSTGRIADTICEATGAKKLTLYSCHNMTADEFKRGETYVTQMTRNIETLRAALN